MHFGFPFQTNLEGCYQDDCNSVVVKAYGALGAPLLATPALNIQLTRNLFRRKNKQASVNIHVGRYPHVCLHLTSINPFGPESINARYTEEDFTAPSTSISGLELGSTFLSYGFNLEQRDPNFVCECGVNLLELGTTLKTGITMGFSGVKWFLSAIWSIPSASSEISTTTTIGPPGIFFALEYVITYEQNKPCTDQPAARVTRLGQRIFLPIHLSVEANVFLTFCTTALPAAAGLLIYRFVILPRRRSKKIA